MRAWASLPHAPRPRAYGAFAPKSEIPLAKSVRVRIKLHIYVHTYACSHVGYVLEWR